ncbi:Hypothetical protein A7982_07191 [Minicystis rosea]|nr:Hypothetical protein A7982_07191 [Minicystis rosea]
MIALGSPRQMALRMRSTTMGGVDLFLDRYVFGDTSVEVR